MGHSFLRGRAILQVILVVVENIQMRILKTEMGMAPCEQVLDMGHSFLMTKRGKGSMSRAIGHGPFVPGRDIPDTRTLL